MRHQRYAKTPTANAECVAPLIYFSCGCDIGTRNRLHDWCRVRCVLLNYRARCVFVSPLRNSYHVYQYRIHLPRYGKAMRRDELRNAACGVQVGVWVFQSRPRTKVHSTPKHACLPETSGHGTGRSRSRRPISNQQRCHHISCPTRKNHQHILVSIVSRGILSFVFE
jgi:hypothetical protein